MVNTLPLVLLLLLLTCLHFVPSPRIVVFSTPTVLSPTFVATKTNTDAFVYLHITSFFLRQLFHFSRLHQLGNQMKERWKWSTDLVVILRLTKDTLNSSFEHSRIIWSSDLLGQRKSSSQMTSWVFTSQLH